MIKVAACESQPVLIEGLKSMFARTGDFQFLGAVDAPPALPDIVDSQAPQVCLIDSNFGVQVACELIAKIRHGTRPIFWGERLLERECYAALQAGACGILRKELSLQEILDSLRMVALGNMWVEDSLFRGFREFISQPYSRLLTHRESEVVDLIRRGRTNREISDALCITVGTVKVHLLHVFEKTGVKNRFELALMGFTATDSGAGNGGTRWLVAEHPAPSQPPPRVAD